MSLKIKVAIVVRQNPNNRYITTEHREINEDDLLRYIKACEPLSQDDLYYEDELEIEGMEYL